jgi:hypothetical protein
MDRGIAEYERAVAEVGRRPCQAGLGERFEARHGDLRRRQHRQPDQAAHGVLVIGGNVERLVHTLDRREEKLGEARPVRLVDGLCCALQPALRRLGAFTALGRQRQQRREPRALIGRQRRQLRRQRPAPRVRLRLERGERSSVARLLGEQRLDAVQQLAALRIASGVAVLHAGEQALDRRA